MKLLHYRRLEGIISSIMSSSYVSFAFEDISVDIFGRNSPKISRHLVEVKMGHGIENLIIVKNKSYKIAIIPTIDPDTEYATVLTVQSRIVEELFSDISFVKLPYWIGQSLVNIIIPDFFAGFREDGKPMFYLNTESIVRINSYKITLAEPVNVGIVEKAAARKVLESLTEEEMSNLEFVLKNLDYKIPKTDTDWVGICGIPNQVKAVVERDLPEIYQKFNETLNQPLV